MFGRKKKYNILVLGSNGMLGHELYETLIKLSSNKLTNIGTVVGLDAKDGIDLSVRHALGDYMMSSIHFDYCINCVAHTDTKSAETTKDGKVLDYKLNALVPKYIAESCKHWKTKLIHVSTDYVFSEYSKSSMWSANNSPSSFSPNDSEVFPINVYGANKLIGELNIKEVFGADSKDYAILRTAWIYGMHNSKSFIHKFIRNVVSTIKENKTECEMTSNECSIPTPCSYVVDCIRDVIDNRRHGTFHAVPYCSNPSGVSRYQFASEILKWYQNDGCISTAFKLVEVERDSYWPKHSVMLSTFCFSMKTWWTLLEEFLDTNGRDILAMANKQVYNY